MELELLNQETLDVMKHYIKNHCVYHINIEDENVFAFLEDFSFSNPIDCTNAEIDEFISSNDCCNSCNAYFHTLAEIIARY